MLPAVVFLNTLFRALTRDRSRVWEEGKVVYLMEGETEWARAEGPPLLSRRLTDQAVKVGTRTRLLVEIASSSPLTVVWLHECKKVEENERIKLVNEGNFYCVDISPVTLDDEGIWKCQGQNARGLVTSQAKLTLVVPRAYKKPEFVEPLRAVLGSAGTVSLETKVIGVPTPTLKWYKEGEEIKPGDVLGLTPDPLDPTLGTYTCIATNCMGSTVSTSRVHVVTPVQPKMDLGLSTSGPKPIFAKELRNEKVKIGTTLSLDCQVKVPPWPDRVSWYNSVGEVKEGPRAHLMEDGMGGYSIRVSPIQASDDGTWRFVATNRGGATSVTTCTVSVSHPKNYRKPKFLDSLKAVLTEEGLVSFECKVVGYPTPLLSWFKDGQELKPGDVYQLTGTNSLGSYCCIARNCMGEAESTAVLTVEDIQSQLTEEERLQLFSDKLPPKFIQGLKSVEAKISEPFTFSVKVSVSPEPTVLWFRDDEHIDESEPRYKLEKDKLGLYSLHIARLEFIDQAEWKCVAMNDFGQSVTSSYLKLNIPRHYKKPKFLEELRAVLSDEGAVNLECKVIGVPQPVLKWFKDGKELKPGDIHRIISGQDGSCCLGTYTCMAQNCMGTVSSSASLLGFQDKGIVGSGVSPKVPEKTNTCVRDTSLSTIQEERTSQLHDTDKSLTLDDRPEEVSFSFDGREVSVSLYETPDLTEEEALQIVEMYADQISEHVSEHNVVELPPMRFTKESSTSGKLLMEAMVIDVSPDYFTPGEVDDLRTDADLEEFSLVEEAMVTPEEEKADIEFPSSPTRQDEVLQFPGRKISQPILKEEKTKRKKRKSTDSDKEDDSLQEFERRKTEKRPLKERKRTESEMEDDSLYEFESRKVIGQNDSKLVENKNDRTENASESCIEVFESGERPSMFKTAELISPGHSRRSLTEDDRTYNTAEESAFDKSEMSVLETLAQSLQEIQRGLAFVESKVISESQEFLSPEVSILESLAQPIAEVQRSLEVMEEKLDEALIGSQVLETLVQPISEFKKSLKMIEEEEALKRKASSIMESLARPLQELEREIALIQEQCYPQRQLSSEERYAKSVEEVQETLTRIIERQESVPHDRKLMKTISVELQELEETANDDLEKYYDRLLACSSELRKKLNDEHDQEIVDILRSMGDLVKPLKRLSAVTSKCISVIVKDYELGGMPSAKLVESLIKPLEALKSSLDLLESVSSLKSHRAIRGVGIPLLYKMSVPMEELQTTIKLVENLSAHTAVEFLVAPLENLIKIVSTIDISTGGEGFLENLGKEGPELVKGINNSLNTIKNTMNSIKANAENVESERELIEKLPSIVKPMEDLQKSLIPIQENIGEDLSYDEVCEVAQNLSKPLQSLRSELSILQHEIEIEHYGDVTGEKKSVLSELIEPLEAVQTSIKCFHESILCKEDPIHLRFVLYALKEMAEPFNILCSKVTKTEEAILQGKVLDPYQGLKNITKAVRELKETSSLTKTDLPVIYGISSTLSKPLDLIENGLCDILFEIYNNDKGDLNINMLKTLAEPFMALQSALLDIDRQSLSGENELPELKQAIKDMQRSVLVIQDHVSFEYGDEPSTIESNIVMLESLVQPLQHLRYQISDIQRTSLRTLIKTDRVLTDIRDSSKDIIAAIKTYCEENDLLSELLKKLGKTVEELGIAADLQNIQIGQGQMLDEARYNMANVLATVATSFGETCKEADELSVQLNTEQRKTLISIQDLILDLKSSVETAVEIMEEKKVGIEQNIATASALEQVKCAMYDFNHSLSSMNEVQPKPPKKSISMDELKDFVVQLESDVNLVIDKISSTVDRNVAQPVLDNILDDVKSVKCAVLKMIEERNLDEIRIQYVLEKVKFIENDLNELSQNTLENEYIPLNDACKTAQAIVSMQDQLIPNSKDEYDSHEVIDTLVENVKHLELIVEKLKLDSKDVQNDENLVAICENLMILQECITPLSSGEKQIEILGEQLRQMKLPVKVIEQSLHKIKINKEDMNEALQALGKVSEIFVKKDSSARSEYFDSESLYESIETPLIDAITDSIESLRSTFKDAKDKKPVKLAWFIDNFEETIVAFGKELSNNINNLDDPQVRQKLIEYIQKLENEISDLRIMESGPLNELKKAVMSLDAVIMKPSQQILPALQNLIKPLYTIHENICNLDIKSIRKEEFKYLEDYLKASSDLEIGLIKLEKSLVTSEELDFKPMLKPLVILNSYVNSISDNPLFEYVDEDSSILQLATLSECITEIKTCLDEIETAVKISPGDKKKIEALLINIAKPVRELQHNVALIQEQALLMNLELKSSELEDLKQAVAVICSHIEGNEYLRSTLNSVYTLKEILEKATPDSFNPIHIAYPMKELKIALEEIEKETSSAAGFTSDLKSAEPLLDICHNVIQIIENCVTESLDQKLTPSILSEEHVNVKTISEQLVRAEPATVKTEISVEENHSKYMNDKLMQTVEKEQKQRGHDELSILKQTLIHESISEAEVKNEDVLSEKIYEKTKSELESKENESDKDAIKKQGPEKGSLVMTTKDEIDNSHLFDNEKESVGSKHDSMIAVSSNSQIPEKKALIDDPLSTENENKIIEQEPTSTKEQNEDSKTKELNSETMKQETEAKIEDNIDENGGKLDKIFKTKVEESNLFLESKSSEKSKKNKNSQDATDTNDKLHEQDNNDRKIEMVLKTDKRGDNNDPVLKAKVEREETEVEENQNKEVNKDRLQKLSMIEKKEDLQAQEDQHLMTLKQMECKDKEPHSNVTEKLLKLHGYINQLENEIISSISIISKTKAKFSVKPILESVLIDIKSMDRVVEKLSQDQKVDYTRLKFIVDKASFIGEDLKFVVNSSLLKEECPTLNAAGKTIEDILSLKLIEEELKDEGPVAVYDTEGWETKSKMTGLETENVEKNEETDENKSTLYEVGIEEAVQSPKEARDQKKVIKENEKELKEIRTVKNEENQTNKAKEKSVQGTEVKLDDKIKEKRKYLEDSQAEMKTENEGNIKNESDGHTIKKEETESKAELNKLDKNETDTKQNKDEKDKVKKEFEAIKNKEEEVEIKQDAIGEMKNEVKEKARTDAKTKNKKEEEEKTVNELETKEKIEEEQKAVMNAGAKQRKDEKEKDTKEETAQKYKEKEEKEKIKPESEKKKEKDDNANEEAEAKMKKGEKVRIETETNKNKEKEEKIMVEERIKETKETEKETYIEAETGKKKEEVKKEKEEKAKNKAETKKKEEEEKVKKETEDKMKKEKEEKAKEEAGAKVKQDEEEKGKKKSEAMRKIQDEEMAKKEAESNKMKEEEKAKNNKEEKGIKEAMTKKEEEAEKAKLEAEVKIREEENAEKKVGIASEKEAEANKKKKVEEYKARKEAEAKKKREEEEEKVRKEEDKKKQEENQKAKKEAEPKEKKEEEEKKKVEAETKMKMKEENVLKEAGTEKEKDKEEKDEMEYEANKKKEELEKTKVETEAKKRKKEEENAKKEAQCRKKKEEEEKLKNEAESKNKEEEEKTKNESEAKKKRKDEENDKVEDEDKRKEEDERSKMDLKDKNKTEEEEKAKKDIVAEQNKEEEKMVKLEAEAKQKKEKAEKANLEAEPKKNVEDEKAKKEAEAIKKEKEEKIKKEGDAKKKVEEEEKAKMESEAKKKIEEEEKVKMEAEDIKKKKEEENGKKDAEANKKKGEEEKTKKEAEAYKKNKMEEESDKIKAEAKKKMEGEEKVIVEAEAKKKKEEEEQAKVEAEAKKKEKKEKTEKEAEAKKNKEDKEKDKMEAEAKKEKEEEKAKIEAEPKKEEKEEKGKKEEGEKKVKKEGEAKKKEEEEKAKMEAEAMKKRQEEEKAKVEAETKKKIEEEKAKMEAEAKEKREEEEMAKAEAEAKKKMEEEKAKAEAKAKKKMEEEKAKMEAEAKKKREEEEKAKKEAEAMKKREEEEKAKAEAEAKKKMEEEKAKAEAEAKKKMEEEKAKMEAEAKKKREEEEKAKVEAEAKKKMEEEKAKAEAETNKKIEEEKAKMEAEAKKKREEEEKAKAEAEAKKKMKEEKAKAEAEAKKKMEEDKAKPEAEAKKKMEEDKAKMEAEAKKKREEEEKAKSEAETKKKMEEEKAMMEAEAKKKREEEEKAKAEAETKKKIEEEKAKMEAEAKKKREEEEKAKKEAEAMKKRVEEEKAKAEAEAKKKMEEEKAKAEAEAKKKMEEEKAKMEAEAKKKREEEEKAKAEAEAKKKMEEEKAKMEAEAKKKREEEEKAKAEAEAKKKMEEEKAKMEAEAKKKREEEEKTKMEAEAKKKREEEEKAKAEAEAKKKMEEEKAKMEAEAKKKREEEEKAKAEAEAKKKMEEEKAMMEVEAKKKREEEEKAKAEAETKKKIEEEKAKMEAEAKKKREEEEKAKKEAEAMKKREEEEKAKAEAEAKKKMEEEKAKAEAEAKKKMEEDKAKMEAEAKKKREEEEKAKSEAETKKKMEEEKAMMEAEAKKKREEEEKAKAEAEAKKKMEEEKAKMEAEAKKKREEEEKAKAEAEAKKKMEEEKAKMEAEAKKKREEEEMAKAEAEAKKKMEEEKAKKEAEATAEKVGEVSKEEAKSKKKKGEMTEKEVEAKKKKDGGEKAKIDEAEKTKEGKNKIRQLEKIKDINEEEKASVGIEAKEKNEIDDKTNNLIQNVFVNESHAKMRKDEAIKELDMELITDVKSKKESEDIKLVDVQVTMKEFIEKEKGKKAGEQIVSSETDIRSENQRNNIEVVELDQEDECFWVAKGLSGSASTYRYPGSDSGYSENIKSYVQSSSSSRKYLIDGSVDIDANYKQQKHISRSPSYETSTTSYLNQSKLKQYLAQTGSDISQDLSPRGYPIQEDYSKKDFSAIHSSKPTDFLMKDYSYNTGSPALDSIRKRIDKSWKNLNRHMSQEYLTSGIKPDALSKDIGGSADQLSSREIYKDFFYVPYKEDFSPLAQSRRYTRRRSASPLPVFSESTAIIRQRSVSRSRYEYHERQPYICSPLRDKRVEHGANVKLTCNIGGDPEPLVEWRKDGQPIESIIDRFIMEYSFGVASLEIKSVIASDAGQYTCVAINPAGQAATTATLRVNTEHWQGIDEYGLSQEISLPLRVPEVSPRVTGLIADSLVPSGGIIALHLQIQGCPRAEVTWLREGVPLKFSPRTHTLVDPSMGLHTFLVEGVTVSESGLYHCRVLSGSSRLLEPAPAHIQVVERRPGDKPALITARPDTRITLTSGEDLTLTCYVSGEPKPRVMFMKGIKDITDGDRTLKESFGEYVRLTLKRALPEDSGTYFIVARNPYGTDRAFSTVKIRERTRSLTPTRRERSSSVFRETLCNGSSSLSLLYL